MLKAMDQARLYSIIKSNVISEKANIVLEKDNTVVFQVLPSANKSEIKFAVEQIFDVKVKSVNTLNVRGKVKRTGNRIGRRKDWKKAYVTLMPGQTLTFGQGKAE